MGLMNRIKFYDMCQVIRDCKSNTELEKIAGLINEFKKDWALTEIRVFADLAELRRNKLRIEHK